MNGSVPEFRPGDIVPAPSPVQCEEDVIVNWAADVHKPLASVICHTYNHVEFIRDALNGFLMQKTDFPFEIIVHDDASTDGTREIIEEYRSRFPNIFRVVFQEKNQYKLGKRPPIVTFPMARGKYIAFCEGDDYWIDINKLYKQVSYLEKDKGCVVVYTDSVAFSGTTVLGIDFGGARRDLSPEELKRAPGIFTLTSCFRNVIDVPPETNIVKYGDQFIWSRLGHHGRGVYMDDILPSFYRVHEGGIYSLQNEVIKRDMRIDSYFGIYLYYKRIGDRELESLFLDRAFYSMLSAQGISPRLIPIARTVTKILRDGRRLFGRGV